MLEEVEIKLQLAMEQISAIDNRTKTIKRMVKDVSEDTQVSVSILDGEKDEGEVLSVQDIFTEMDTLLENLKNVADKVETLDTRVFEMKEEAEKSDQRDESTFKFAFWTLISVATLLIGMILHTANVSSTLKEIRGTLQTQAERTQGTGSKDPGGDRQVP